MKKSIVRLTFNAALVAVYIVLSMPMLTIQFSNLKLTFEQFPVILGAILFGPMDGMIIGGVGEFINQLTTFGITPTTLLWIAPIIVRGAIVGIGTKIFKSMKPQAIVQKRVPILFAIVCVFSGICHSVINTFALYVDSKLYGYYTYAGVFGVFVFRILLSVITSILIVVVITPILRALRRTELI